MVLKNITKKTIVTKDLKIASSFSDQVFGLLKKSCSRSLLLQTRFGIHTFFFKEPIDIIILDKNHKVVKLKENLTPNSLFFWNPKYDLILELPLKTIRKSNTYLGCYFSFVLV